MWKNQLLSQWMRPFQTKVSEWSLKRWNNLHPEELRWLALRPSRELKLHVDFWQTDSSNSRLKCEQFKSDSDRKPQPPSSVRVIEECDSETFSRSENSQQNPQGQWAREAPATRRSWRYRLVLFYYNNTHSISKKSLGKIQQGHGSASRSPEPPSGLQPHFFIAKGHFQLKLINKDERKKKWLHRVRVIPSLWQIYPNSHAQINPEMCDPHEKKLETKTETVHYWVIIEILG